MIHCAIKYSSDDDLDRRRTVNLRFTLKRKIIRARRVQWSFPRRQLGLTGITSITDVNPTLRA